MNDTGEREPVTITTLARMKRDGDKIAALTAYGYCEAHAVSSAGAEIILVGDSLRMVVQGHDSSLPVSVDDMAYHMRCVCIWGTCCSTPWGVC